MASSQGQAPDRIEWTGGPPPSRRERRPSDFYRSPVRVLILGFVAFVPYFYWWMWQLFHFTKREGFPRARRFWWIFVPIYGFVVIYRQVDDLDKAARSLNRAGLSAGGLITLLIAANVVAAISSRFSAPADTIGFLAGLGLEALALFLVQRLANDYIKTRYPEAQTIGMTWGEITATILGAIWLVLILLPVPG